MYLVHLDVMSDDTILAQWPLTMWASLKQPVSGVHNTLLQFMIKPLSDIEGNVAYLRDWGWVFLSSPTFHSVLCDACWAEEQIFYVSPAANAAGIGATVVLEEVWAGDQKGYENRRIEWPSVHGHSTGFMPEQLSLLVYRENIKGGQPFTLKSIFMDNTLYTKFNTIQLML